MRRLISKIRGRQLLRLPLPAWLLRLVGRIGDQLQRLGIDTGAVRYESMLIGTSGLRADDSRSLQALGLELRPIEETVEAQMLWMHAQGHLKDRHIGVLAERRSD